MLKAIDLLLIKGFQPNLDKYPRNELLETFFIYFEQAQTLSKQAPKRLNFGTVYFKVLTSWPRGHEWPQIKFLSTSIVAAWPRSRKRKI